MAQKNKKKTKKKSVPPVRRGLQKAGGKATFVGELDDVTPVFEFLDNFRATVDPLNQAPSKLISIKIPETLLAAFRFKAEQQGVPYQTMIKKLMEQWLRSSSPT